ncbi:MAG: universal stress protein [Myxococcota bacterium]|nr:universal stress protein [Myxococcota bacterium]
MYKKIYVPVDNSAHSNQAIHSAVQLGKVFGSELVGSHIYAAKMHDYRFKQMEYSLPEEYLEENELERQRKIHDSLITMGLKLISDSYLEGMRQICEKEALPFEARMIDGQHHVEIRRDLAQSDADLLVIGALGLGRQRDSLIGSVCERVIRSCSQDAWVVKHVPGKDEPERDTILVAIDGSPQSFGALHTAFALARKFGKRIEVIGVYDPYLHYLVFNGLVGTLTEKASKVFRFEEQNQLHEEIIDTGLAQIYQSHLDVAQQIARAEEIEVRQTLLDGKTFQKIHDHVRKTKPWLLVMGRIGLHSDPNDTELGSNSENLLRLSECDVLLTTSQVRPQIDVRAEESIRWSEQAEERMARVPKLVVGIARTAILRMALEKGHSVITSSLIDEAMARFMPKQAPMDKLAEAVAIGRAQEQALAMCKGCGMTASEPDPALCSVCGGTVFEVLTAEVVERLIESEGGAVDEAAYDGRKLQWTQEARRALRAIDSAYLRRRTKARIEKTVRLQKRKTVTLEFAQKLIEEETGVPMAVAPSQGSAPQHDEGAVEAASESESAAVCPMGDHSDGDRLIARDSAKMPLFSSFEWSEDATERILRVPSGFMRDRTQARIEELARQHGDTRIDLVRVEEGVELGLQTMAEQIAQNGDGAEDAEQSEHVAAAAKCPAVNRTEIEARESHAEQPLNEVSELTELTAMRMLLSKQGGRPQE